MPSRVNLRTAPRGPNLKPSACGAEALELPGRQFIRYCTQLGDHTSGSPSTIVIVRLNDTCTAYGSMWTQILVTPPPNFFKTYDYLI